jgi:spore cortex formation protein SpoVR/YcgB (stage V sporulation)
MIEWLKSHTNVVFQPPVGHPAYNGMNPYALGFAMYSDIKRICEAPTDEDRDWFPDIAGSDWLATLDHAMRNFKDESFIGQYLSPRLMRAFRLFTIVDDEKAPTLEVSAIHDEAGYRVLREAMSRQYDLGSREPNIQVWSVNLRGDRSLVPAPHAAQRPQRRPLHDKASRRDQMKCSSTSQRRLWGNDFPVISKASSAGIRKGIGKGLAAVIGVRIETPALAITMSGTPRAAMKSAPAARKDAASVTSSG